MPVWLLWLTCLLVPAVCVAKLGDAGTSAGFKQPLILMVDTPRPYVQAQVLVTLRLARHIDKYPAAWFFVSRMPALDDSQAIVKPLPQQTTRQVVTRGGQRYLVTQWRYALFPQTPGRLTIGPVGFYARVANADGYAGFVTFYADPLSLQVRGIPPEFTGDVWLPAKSVHVYQGFNPDQKKITVGSPISRRLALTFDGAQSGELPAFDGGAQAGLEIHAFRPTRSEHSTPSGLVAALEQKISLTPTRLGEITIPTIEVPWWNTVTDQQEVARFPGYTITVAAAASGWDAGTGSGQAQASVAGSAATGRLTPLVWIAVALAVLVCAIGGLGWLFLRRRGGFQRRWGWWRRQRLKRRVLQACAHDDAPAAARAIVEFAQAVQPVPGRYSLRQMAMREPEPLRDELLQLNTVLYGTEPHSWRGQSLARAFRRWLKVRGQRKAKVAETGVPLLHPLACGEPLHPSGK